MSDDTLRTTAGSSRAAALAADLRRRRSEIDDQRKEIGGLIKQTASEAEKAAIRAREAGGLIRQLESTTDGYSPADVKRAYTSAQEAQMRQFMMQSQLEQFRNRQTALDTTDEMLRQLIDAADELAEISDSPVPSVFETPALEPEGGTRTVETARIAMGSVEVALQRLSRELQDEIAQTLSDIVLRAEVCERLVEMDKQRAKGEITRLKQVTSTALKITRNYVHELRSPALEEIGLATALRRYVDALKSSDRIQAALQVSGVERDLPRAVEIVVFRIVQEALANSQRHAGVKNAEVRLRYEPAQLLVVVSDEGKGFDVAATMESARLKEQSGLADMELRAGIIGAALQVESKPGSGTTVTLLIQG